MADSQAAAETLQTALDRFEQACGKDPDCSHIISACDRVEREIQIAYPKTQDRGSDQGDTPVSKQPKSLAQAAEPARQALKRRRASLSNP